MLHLSIATILFALPQMTWLERNHGKFTPFTVADTVSEQVFDQTRLYAVGPKRWMSKGILFDEMEVYDLRKVASPFPMLHSFLLGSVAFPFKNLAFVWNVAQILLPVLLWFVLFRFFGNITDNRWAAALLSWVTCCLPFTPWDLIFRGGASLNQPMETIAIPHPALSLTILVLAMRATVTAMTRETRKTLFAAWFYSGLLFYTSYYGWLSYFAGLLVLVAIVYKFRTPATTKRLIYVMLGGMLVGLPYLLYVSKDARTLTTNLFHRLGEPTHRPSFFGLALFAMGALGLTLYQKVFRSDPSRARRQEATWTLWILGAIITGAGLGQNFQIISGFDARHFVGFLDRIVLPVGTMVAASAIVYLTRRYHLRKWYAVVMVIWIAPIVILSGYAQYASAAVTSRAHRGQTSRDELIRWMLKNVPAQDVVGTTDPELITLLPVLTANWNFLPAGERTSASDEEILRRYLLLGYLQRKELPTLESDLGRPHGKIRLHLPYVLFSSAFLDENLRKVGREFFPKIKPSLEFADRRLDYVVIPGNADMEFLEKTFLAAKKLYASPEWTIVRLDKVRPENSERDLSSKK